MSYAAGPFAIGYGHQAVDTQVVIKDSKAPSKNRYNLIGASYDLGGAKLVGSWSDAKGARLNNATDGTAKGVADVTTAIADAFGITGSTQDLVDAVSAAKLKENRYQLGVSVPMGMITLYAGYANNKSKLNGKRIGDASGYMLAATHNLDDSTTLYAGYSRVKASLTGTDVRGKATKTVAGLRYKF